LISFRPLSFFLPFSISFCFRWFRFAFVGFVLFRFHFVDFVSFRFVSFSLISFRFVSFLFRFALYRYPFSAISWRKQVNLSRSLYCKWPETHCLLVYCCIDTYILLIISYLQSCLLICICYLLIQLHFPYNSIWMNNTIWR
jgi:hypothetical protein